MKYSIAMTRVGTFALCEWKFDLVGPDVEKLRFKLDPKMEGDFRSELA